MSKAIIRWGLEMTDGRRSWIVMDDASGPVLFQYRREAVAWRARYFGGGGLYPCRVVRIACSVVQP